MEYNLVDYNKKLIQEEIGWAYRNLKWLTGKEAKLANRKRDALLKSLFNEVNYSFARHKVHIGKLSPGCVICGEGYWSCLFINKLCTANCFYCPQDRKIKKEDFSKEGMGRFIIRSPKDYATYLKRFNFKGVGISGGECLLVFKKLLSYIKEIRKNFGKEIYIWIYTNGSLINEDKLRKLKEAGLNEIRFNISARNYDLRPVELAVNIIDTVSVEIPAIPEDYKIVEKCLPKMQKIGVKYLNLHQLFATEFNYKNFVKRTYTFLHNHPFPIFESEITALKLMRYAIYNRIGLPINYCSGAYKNMFQSRGVRRWAALLVKEDFEEITDIKFIRRLSIQDSPPNIKKIIRNLQSNKCRHNLWLLSDTQKEIFIHSSLLKYINFKKYNLTITYFNILPQTFLRPDEVGKAIELNSHNKVFIKREFQGQFKLLHPTTVKSFQKLFIENMREKEVLEDFCKNYGLTLNEWRKETKLLLTIKIFEYGEEGFPYIY